jgi:TolB-like protein
MRAAALFVALEFWLVATGSKAQTRGGELIAVLEIRNLLPPADGLSIQAQVFSDQIRAFALEFAPALQVMTRENVLTLLAASGKRLEDCEGECEVETGRRLGADYVVSGELYRIGPSIRLGMRLHSTKTGTLLAAAQAEGADLPGLDTSLRGACAQLMTRFKGGAATRNDTALQFSTDRSEKLTLALLAANGTFTCEGAVTPERNCRVAGASLGPARLQGTAASGETPEAFAVDFNILERSADYRVTKRSWTPTILGVVLFAAGGATVLGLASKSYDPGNRDVPFIIGGVIVAGVGAIVAVADLLAGHAWHVEQRLQPPGATGQ